MFKQTKCPGSNFTGAVVPCFADCRLLCAQLRKFGSVMLSLIGMVCGGTAALSVAECIRQMWSAELRLGRGARVTSHCYFGWLYLSALQGRVQSPD